MAVLNGVLLWCLSGIIGIFLLFLASESWNLKKLFVNSITVGDIIVLIFSILLGGIVLFISILIVMADLFTRIGGKIDWDKKIWERRVDDE